MPYNRVLISLSISKICNWIRRDQQINFLRRNRSRPNSKPKIPSSIIVPIRFRTFCITQTNYIRGRTEIAHRFTSDIRGIEKIGVNHIIVWCQRLPAIGRPWHILASPREDDPYICPGGKDHHETPLTTACRRRWCVRLPSPVISVTSNILYDQPNGEDAGLRWHNDKVCRYQESVFKEQILSRNKFRGAVHILIEFPCSFFTPIQQESSFK